MFRWLTDAFRTDEQNAHLNLMEKREGHIRFGHPISKSVRVEGARFERHPKNDQDFVFAANLMRCDDCGLHWVDQGFETRNGVADFLRTKL